MKMSIFDRFGSKEVGEQKKNSFFSAQKTVSKLDAAVAEARAQYPDDGDTVNNFARILMQASKARRKKAQEADQSPLKAEAYFFLAK